MLAGYPSLAGRLGHLSLRQMFELLRAKRKRDRERWQRQAFLMAEVRNSGFGTKEAVSPRDIVPSAFGERRSKVTPEMMEEMRRRSEERARREARQNGQK